MQVITGNANSLLNLRDDKTIGLGVKLGHNLSFISSTMGANNV